MTKNMYLFYKKPVTVSLSSRDCFISDNLGFEDCTSLEYSEYESLKREYGQYSEDDYDAYEVGEISYSGSSSSYLVFNEKEADKDIRADIVNNLLDNNLTIFFDFENLEIEKHQNMFEDDEIYPKLFDFISNKFINLRSSRRYILKIEGVSDEQDPNMLKWELSRIASINFRKNTWTNWNKVSYSGFIRYENNELIMLEHQNSLLD